MICNKAKLSEILGLSIFKINRLEKLGLPIVSKAGVGSQYAQFNTAEVIDWFIARGISESKGGKDTGAIYDSDAELGRLRNSQANKAELEFQLLEGSVRLADDVQLENGLIDAEIRQAILSMPARLAPMLVKYRTVKEMTAALKTDVIKTLEKLSRSADGEEEEDDEHAATE